jgi:hypothetical protein
MNPALAALLKRAEHVHGLIDDLSARVTADNRNFSDAELTLIDGWKDELKSIGRQASALNDIETLLEEHNKIAADLAPTPHSEPRTAGVRTEARPQWATAGEFLRDMVGSFPNMLNGGHPDQAMQARIAEHLQARASQVTGDTLGLLPENIVGQIHTDVDESRPFVQSIGVKPLGNVSGKTFNRPVVTQHVPAGQQAAELQALPSGKLVIEPVPFLKGTAGSSLEVSQQDLDWTDPAAWQAVVNDMEGMYAEATDDLSSMDLATKVLQSTAATGDDLDAWIDALYEASYIALTANGTQRARVRRTPNVVWTSPDMWKTIGRAIDKARVQAQPEVTGLGSGGVGTVNGTILDLPRIMVPGLPAGTAIMGRSTVTEFYEQRVGLLQAVLPAKVGVELAVPGFIAYGTLDLTCFCKITAFVPPPEAFAATEPEAADQVEADQVEAEQVEAEQEAKPAPKRRAS